MSAVVAGEASDNVVAAVGSISGFLWNDNDADGVFDTSETRVTGGRTVFIDSDKDGSLDTNETRVTSDVVTGVYRFEGLSAGTYAITRVFPSGYRLSNGTGGGKFVSVTLTAGQSRTDINLGSTNQPIPPTPGVSRWVTVRSLPVSLGETSGGVIGSRLYVIGDGSSRVFRYDPSANTWASLASRSVAAKDQLAEVVGGKLYVFGGVRYTSTGQQVLTSAQSYDPSTNTWRTLRSMPYAVAAAQTAVIGGRIYIAGGFTSGNVTHNRMIRYDPATNTYTELARLPRNIDSAAAGTDGQRLFMFGGRDVGDRPGNGFADCYAYNPTTNTWTRLNTNLPVARGGVSKAPFVNGEFYIIGGETADQYTQTGADGVYDRVDIYNPLTNTWRQGPAMTVNRHGIAPLALGTRIYVAGGGTVQGKSASSIVDYLQLV